MAIELKNGPFKPEYAGKLNFYLTALDEQVKMAEDNPSIGLILCKDRNNVVAEYALRNGVNLSGFRAMSWPGDCLRS